MPCAWSWSRTGLGRPGAKPSGASAPRPGRGGLRVEPPGVQQGGGLAVAVAQQPQQHVLIGHAGMAEIASLGKREPDDLLTLWGQPGPYRSRPVVTDHGTQQPG